MKFFVIIVGFIVVFYGYGYLTSNLDYSDVFAKILGMIQPLYDFLVTLVDGVSWLASLIF